DNRKYAQANPPGSRNTLEVMPQNPAPSPSPTAMMYSPLWPVGPLTPVVASDNIPNPPKPATYIPSAQLRPRYYGYFVARLLRGEQSLHAEFQLHRMRMVRALAAGPRPTVPGAGPADPEGVLGAPLRVGQDR